MRSQILVPWNTVFLGVDNELLAYPSFSWESRPGCPCHGTFPTAVPQELAHVGDYYADGFFCRAGGLDSSNKVQGGTGGDGNLADCAEGEDA